MRHRSRLRAFGWLTACVLAFVAVLPHLGAAGATAVAFGLSAGFHYVENPVSAVFGFRYPIRLPDPTGNIVTNGKATFLLPKGNAFHEVTFNLTDGGVAMTVAQMKARVTSIVMKVGGKAVREWTPTSLDISNATNGAQWAAADGYLHDYFSEPWRRTYEGEERGAMGTQGVGDITYEIQFGAAAVTPGVVGWAVVDSLDRPFKAYPFRHVRVYTGMPVINGRTQWPGGGLLREVGLFYDRIHFLSNLVSIVRIETDKNVKWEDLPRALVAEKLAKRGLALQANTYTVAFTAFSEQLTDLLSSFKQTDGGALDIINDFRLEYVGTGAGNTDVVVEQYQIFK